MGQPDNPSRLQRKKRNSVSINGLKPTDLIYRLGLTNHIEVQINGLTRMDLD